MPSDSKRRVRRAMIVDRWGSVSWDEYLRQTSLADDGRSVVERRRAE